MHFSTTACDEVLVPAVRIEIFEISVVETRVEHPTGRIDGDGSAVRQANGRRLVYRRHHAR